MILERQQELSTQSSSQILFQQIDKDCMRNYAYDEMSSTSELFKTKLDLLLSTTSKVAIETYTTELAKLFTEVHWAREFFTDASSLTTLKELVPYYKEIQTLLVNEKYDECDIFLGHLRTELLTDVLLVGLLRLTYSKRDKISSWQTLKEKVIKELDIRKYDGSVLLNGI
jgi:hypothetical protein